MSFLGLGYPNTMPCGTSGWLNPSPLGSDVPQGIVFGAQTCETSVSQDTLGVPSPANGSFSPSFLPLFLPLLSLLFHSTSPPQPSPLASLLLFLRSAYDRSTPHQQRPQYLAPTPTLFHAFLPSLAGLRFPPSIRRRDRFQDAPPFEVSLWAALHLPSKRRIQSSLASVSASLAPCRRQSRKRLCFFVLHKGWFRD